MKKYYTRVCNFYYGKKSIKLLNQKKTLPLKGNKEISFDRVEIISRDSIKSINIKNVKKLPNLLRKKIENDLKIIAKKNTNFSNFNFKKLPNIMGILNLTPDSFSDGGKFNNKKQGLNHALHLLKSGADIIDIGGESTRPGSKSINKEKEWNRIKDILKDSNKKFPISVDTRKSDIMNKSVKFGVKLINDVSGLDYDHQTIEILKKFNIPFVIQHSQGNPEIMQRNPKYKNVLLDVYDFFEKKIKYIRANGIKHNNIILDPGIGFGKNLKHNMNLISNISIFHSLGFPVMLGLSRKRFIKDLSGKNDTKERLGGTLSSSIFALMQGVQILRTHDVNELIQGIKVFKNLTKN
jgi:dihydropteroate synthase